MHTAYIGLGSNLDNPKQQLHKAETALRQLPSTGLCQLSPLYQSKAVGPTQPDFINACAELSTQLSAIELLDALQAIEQQQKRVRIEHWGPRTLDLDILLFDQQIIDSERLKVPHPYLTVRSFVIVPLYAIAPSLTLPNGPSIESLWQACDSSDLVQLAKEL